MPDLAQAARPWTLRCGTLLDGSGTTPRTAVTLTIEHGRIVDVADAGTAPTTPDVDWSQHTVIPGLVDAHAHPCFGTEGDVAWDAVADDTSARFAWGLMAAQSALAAGVTTVIDVGSAHGSALDVAAALRRGHATGPRLLAAGGALTTTGGHGEQIGTIADSSTELVSAVRRAVRDGADVIKVMATGGAIDPHTNRRRAQYSADELRALVGEAHRLGRRVVAHANATEGIANAVAADVDIIAHCNWLGTEPDTITVDWQAVDAMRTQGTTIDLNLQGALRDLASTDGIVTDWRGSQPRDRWQLLAPLRERGIPIFLTSDGFGPAIAGFPGTLRQFHESSHVPIEQVIAMATSVPADAHGLDGIGRVSVGAVADLTVLIGDATSDTSALERPVAVYRDGVEVVRDGWMRQPSVHDVADASRAQSALLARVLR